jgi:RNA polymerase sigma-70 factor (ECF subfamily)
VHEADRAVDQAIDWARAGDPRGFEYLFRAFAPAVAGYLRTCAVGDPDGIANDVFLRAFRSIGSFRGDASRFRSWLFTIAHNVAVDEARRRRRQPKTVPFDAVSDPMGGNVEFEATTALASERVQRLLDGLSADQRDVLVLRVVADLSVAETAAVLGKGYEAVKALQRRGLAALARAISSQEAVPR